MDTVLALVEKEDLVRWARSWEWLYDPRYLTLLAVDVKDYEWGKVAHYNFAKST